MLEGLLLGKNVTYIETYTPELLFPIPRSLARDKIGLSSNLIFEGVDIWNGYELSWLNSKGKPEIALAEFIFPCSSLNIVESKSFKLYLNSFNQSAFASIESVKETLIKDLTKVIEGPVSVELYSPSQASKNLTDFAGICLDCLDVETDTYHVQPDFLHTLPDKIEEVVYSDLLKSNCLATGQPDWGSVLIRYYGKKIDHEGLLKYIISYRSHSGFAEHCVEQIFSDILERCQPDLLTVYARYTRRGGLEINPFRSNFESSPSNKRQLRQ